LDGEIVGQRESMKNREGVLPVGTRVKPAYDKLSTREGEVVGHSEDGTQMIVKWDDRPYPSSFMIPEIRRAN